MKKAIVMTMAAFLATLLVVSIVNAGDVNAGEIPGIWYSVDIQCNFIFDRTIKIKFSPKWEGERQTLVIVGPAKISESPPSPLEGESAIVKKVAENKWKTWREAGFSAATITLEEGKLIMSYPYGRSFAEGELRLLP